jgi:hypothetical protein
MLEQLGSSLYDLVYKLMAEKKDSASNLVIRRFIDTYEQLYFFEKEKNLVPRFSRATQKLADFLITRELASAKTYQRRMETVPATQTDFKLAVQPISKPIKAATS